MSWADYRAGGAAGVAIMTLTKSGMGISASGLPVLTLVPSSVCRTKKQGTVSGSPARFLSGRLARYSSSSPRSLRPVFRCTLRFCSSVRAFSENSMIPSLK